MRKFLKRTLSFFVILTLSGVCFFGLSSKSYAQIPIVTETQITTDGNIQEYPAIYNDKIVWEDLRNGNWDIYMYDLSTSTETQITTTDGNTQTLSAIYDDRIVWTDDRNGNYDIYLATLTYPDETPPEFVILPGDTRKINIDEGQLITENPYIIKAKAQDNVAVSKVEFYVDDNLICTEETTDANGVYECSWDTSKYHSQVKVIAYDTSDNQSEALIRNATIQLNDNDAEEEIEELPETGNSGVFNIILPMVFFAIPSLAYIRKKSF